MTVLYGTVEFFEREIYNYLNENQLRAKSEDSLYDVTSKLKKEILYDFVCDERIRCQLDNFRKMFFVIITF
ncbi:hypothetical protein KHB02_013775 [Bacillus sp. FJAT-50051]|uniref:Uncharacterized protein n=1 Tax=Neobacillus citreus TaxID=2833578 RepID=A0A942YA68_9BACI|nr:hypothetical protein [Neobacillus citreus]